MATGTFRSRVPVFLGVSGEHQASPLRTTGALETSAVGPSRYRCFRRLSSAGSGRRESVAEGCRDRIGDWLPPRSFVVLCQHRSGPARVTR
jgi:hypothetical protein